MRVLKTGKAVVAHIDIVIVLSWKGPFGWERLRVLLQAAVASEEKLKLYLPEVPR